MLKPYSVKSHEEGNRQDWILTRCNVLANGFIRIFLVLMDIPRAHTHVCDSSGKVKVIASNVLRLPSLLG
jgi:hypothetical protein